MIIGLSGYKGRMGQEILSILQEKNIDTILNDFGDNKSNMFDKADAVIDFSSPSGLKECIQEAKRTKTTLISGTTVCKYVNRCRYHKENINNVSTISSSGTI